MKTRWFYFDVKISFNYVLLLSLSNFIIMQSISISYSFNDNIDIKNNSIIPMEKGNINNIQYGDLYGKWIIKDSDRDIKTYEPWTSGIFLMEGMQGLEINQNGDCVLYGFDKVDIPTEIYGRCEIDESIIKIKLNEDPSKSIKFEIISLEKNTLKIKALYE
jgi:hypothetical protein